MDKYQKVRVLGKGSFGSAILIKRKSDNQLFVVKEVSLAKMSKKERDEARHECTVLQQLQHPNIVRYVEQFENRNNLYIVMEYCDGGDLAIKVKQSRGPMKESTIMYYFSQICLAMEYLHVRHILHRDIKTMNVFLMKNGAVKLGDFGISTVLRNTMGMANTVCGTPYYFSPELCRNRPYNNKSDIWALGVLLYECATGGRHPFDGTSMNQLMQRIVKGSYSPLSSQYSSDFRKLVDWCLQKEPMKRPSIKQTLGFPLVRGSLEQLEENLMLATQCRVRLKDIIDFESGMEKKQAKEEEKVQEKASAASPQRPTQSPPLSPRSAASPPPSGVSPGQAAAMAMAQQNRAVSPPVSPKVGPKPGASPTSAAAQKKYGPDGVVQSPFYHKPQARPNPLQPQLVAATPRSPSQERVAPPAAEEGPAARPRNNMNLPVSPTALPARSPHYGGGRGGGEPALRADMNRVDAIIAKYGQNVDEKAKETIHAYMRRKQEEYLKRQKEELEKRERRNELRQKELKRVIENQRQALHQLEQSPPKSHVQDHGANQQRGQVVSPSARSDGRSRQAAGAPLSPRAQSPSASPPPPQHGSPSSPQTPSRSDQGRVFGRDPRFAAPAKGGAGTPPRKVVYAANSPRLAKREPEENPAPSSRPASRQRAQPSQIMEFNMNSPASRAGAGGNAPSHAGNAERELGGGVGVNKVPFHSPRSRAAAVERERASAAVAERMARLAALRDLHLPSHAARGNGAGRGGVASGSPRGQVSSAGSAASHTPSGANAVPGRYHLLAPIQPKGADERRNGPHAPALNPGDMMPSDAKDAMLFERVSPRLLGDPRYPHRPSNSPQKRHLQPLPSSGDEWSSPRRSPRSEGKPSAASQQRTSIQQTAALSSPSKMKGAPAPKRVSATSHSDDTPGKAQLIDVRYGVKEVGPTRSPAQEALRVLRRRGNSGAKSGEADLPRLDIAGGDQAKRQVRGRSSEAEGLYAGMARECVSSDDLRFVAPSKPPGAREESPVPSMLEALRSLRGEEEERKSTAAAPATDSAVRASQLTLLKQRQRQQHGGGNAPSSSGTSQVDYPRRGDGRDGKADPLTSPPRSPSSQGNGDAAIAARYAADARERGTSAESSHTPRSAASAGDRRSSVDGYAEMLQHLKDLLQKRRVARGASAGIQSSVASSNLPSPSLGPQSPSSGAARSPPSLKCTRPSQPPGAILAAAPEANHAARRMSDTSPSEGECENEDDEEDSDFEDEVPLSPVRCAELNDTLVREKQANAADKYGGRQGERDDVYTNDVDLTKGMMEEEEEGEEGYTGYYQLPSPRELIGELK